jgi:general secretion pathway protein A
MYKTFFNLKLNPFELTPDPAFLFTTRRHNEALAALYYGVRRHKGFVVVTGEIGTGKTLLLRCLLKELSQSQDVAYAYLFNGLLSPLEFLQYIVSDFGLNASSKNKSELLFELSQFVISRGSKQLTTVVILDEAHLLSAAILEEVRLLTNLETAQAKLLQVVLVGQPELDQKLDSTGLRQLKQRIALRARLEPLNLGETKGYIERRLEIAGIDVGASQLFPESAIAAIFRHSRGFPRLINTICENSLIAAYAQQIHSVTPAIIDDVAQDFRIGARESEPAGNCSAFQREIGAAADPDPFSFLPAAGLSVEGVSSRAHAFPLIEPRGETPEKASFSSGCTLPEREFVEAYSRLRQQS